MSCSLMCGHKIYACASCVLFVCVCVCVCIRFHNSHVHLYTHTIIMHTTRMQGFTQRESFWGEALGNGCGFIYFSIQLSQIFGGKFPPPPPPPPDETLHLHTQTHSCFYYINFEHLSVGTAVTALLLLHIHTVFILYQVHRCMHVHICSMSMKTIICLSKKLSSDNRAPSYYTYYHTNYCKNRHPR